MRILLINKYWYVKGGAERYLFNLRRLLETEGHTVEIFAMQHPRNQPATYASHFVPHVDFRELTLVERLRVPFRVIWFPLAAELITHVLDDFRPDLVHVSNIYHQLSPSILVPIRQRNIPIVQRLHDYKLICPNYLLYTQGAPCTRCRNRNYFQAVRHRCVHNSLSWSLLAAVEMTLHKTWRLYERYVAAFTAASAFVKTMAQTFGISPSQVVHVPNFVFPGDFTVSSTDEGYLVYIGRLSREKGLPTLLRAMRQVPRARLWIIGEGPMRAVLEQIADQWELTNVQFTGYLGGARLNRALSGARFTVLPSEWYEVSPQSVLESFAVGKPVVAARIGGIPELVEEGRDGLLFSPGDADELAACIRRLWDDPAQAREMGMQSRRKVESRYGPAPHYAQLMSLYEGLVKP